MDKTTQIEAGFQIFTEIGIINQLAKTVVESALPGKLRWSHFSVMNHFLRRSQEQSPGHLAAAFQVTNAAMTNTLAKMQQWGYVSIRNNPKDNRAKLVKLTDAGREAHQHAVIAIAPTMQKMLAEIGMDVILALEPNLRELREKMDAARD